MDNEKKYSSEGRVLRPRKKVSSTDAGRDGERRSYGEHRNYGEHRPYGERRSYGEGRSNDGERRSYGEGRPNDGERRSYGQGGYKKNYGERRSYGQGRPNDGERRPYGERRSYGEGRPSEGGERRYSKPAGQGGYRKSYGNSEGGERRGYNGRRDFDDQAGGRRSYNNSGRKPYGKPGFNKAGAKKPFKRDYQFTDRDDENINGMLNRRSQADQSKATSNAPATFQEEIRLNKFIANSGVCSRREADTLIQAGVVTVNGEVVTELGTKVNVLKDEIKFNGERLKGEEKVYIVMNKPKGYVTTASDPHAEKTVMDLLHGCETRVFPVGRLDKATTGVLMFTNDGEMAEKLTHPSFNKKKIYQVILDRELKQEDYDKIITGITLSDGDIKADELEYTDASDHRKLGIEIHSGKNRIVRRIFESLGYEVRALDRVYFAGLTKKGLQKGEWRYLTEGEVNILRMGAYL